MASIDVQPTGAITSSIWDEVWGLTQAYYDTGSWVTMIRFDASGAVVSTSLTLWDNFIPLKVIQESSTANAPLMKLDPADPAVYWLPSQSYPYAALPVSTVEERAALRDRVVTGAGAGKL